MTDADVKRKAVKLVVVHIRKKMEDKEFDGREYIDEWLSEIDELLTKEEFEKAEYMEMRRKFNDALERTMDIDMRNKFRDSWYSFGKALDKKVKKR